MKNYFNILISSFLLLCFGCSKPGGDIVLVNADTAYFIFGHFYGECSGEQCIETFKLQGGKLFEDSNDIYGLAVAASPNPYQGNFQELDQSIFEEVTGLENEIPAELFFELDTVIGQPDAGDWGGFYIEHYDGTTVRKWAIDTAESNIPQYLHDFNKKIAEAIFNINN